MNQFEIYLNLDAQALRRILKDESISKEIHNKIDSENNRVEFVEEENYLFVIFYFPEYDKKTRTINTVEVNILFNAKEKFVRLFAYNTEYFFEKYKSPLEEISFKTFGGFIEKFLSVVLEDESRIIEHILLDTDEVKKEYLHNADNYHLIRHLTNIQINISSLKLMVANQNKLIDLINDYTNKTQQSSLHYRKNYIMEELNYVKEFSETLMSSINTKFQVRSSDDLYRFTKYSFITFVSTLIVDLVLLFKQDWNSGYLFFLGTLGSVFLVTLLVLIFFRNKK